MIAIRARELAAVVLASGAIVAQSAPPVLQVSRQVVLMGTRATLTTWDEDRARALTRLEQLLQSLEETEAALSTWRSDSEISRLNASAGHGPQQLSPATCALFRQIDRWVNETGGTFDPAIGPITAAWDVHGQGRIPTESALAAARAASGWRKIHFEATRCGVAMPAGASLDVGGFGKGAALDRAREAIGSDPAPWLIDLGGQVAVSGTPPHATGWAIDVAHPRNRGRAMTTVHLTRGSLSTSAGSERDLFVRRTRVGHIIDPSTGSPSSFSGSVTVWADSALVADILSTALYVMGPKGGLAWANAHDVPALFARPYQNGSVDLQRSRLWVPTGS